MLLGAYPEMTGNGWSFLVLALSTSSIARSHRPISQIQRSIDGGLTYGNAATAGAVGQAGAIAVDQNDGTVYISGSNGSVSVGIPPAPGLPPLTYTTHDVAGSGNAHLFFT